jgi:hypothetical protein
MLSGASICTFVLVILAGVLLTGVKLTGNTG